MKTAKENTDTQDWNRLERRGLGSENTVPLLQAILMQ